MPSHLALAGVPGLAGSMLLLVLVLAAVVVWPVPGRELPVLAHPLRASVEGVDGVAGEDADPSGKPPQGVRARWGWRWRQRARRNALEGALADLVAALVAPLRAGVPPAVAVAAAGSALPEEALLASLVRDLSVAAARGAPVADVWSRYARIHRSADLSFVGQSWALSELTGAPLADALACSERVLRDRARARERLAAAAAGPKASMAVLCLLPASGPVVGAVMGMDPMTLYFSSPVATASLALGSCLGLGAWWWSRRILRAAS